MPQYGGGKEEWDRTNAVRAITMDETGVFQEATFTKADLSREMPRIQKVHSITGLIDNQGKMGV